MPTIQNKPLKIYNASAGSGKTYTLVQEYLRIILHDKDAMKFRTILAMTFTNKAAKEMKSRVLEALIDLRIPSHQKTQSQTNFLKDTSKNIGISSNLIEERAGKILNKILHNYSSFSIMTIDKFTHKIIRTFAKDLGISIDFDLEMDINSLRKNVTDTLFDQIGRNDELTKRMQAYANDNLNNDKSWNFAKQLFEFSDLLFKEDAIKSIALLKKLKDSDFIDIQKQLVSENSKIENSIKTPAKEALDLIKSKHLTADDFQGKSSSILTYFSKLANWNIKLAKDSKTVASSTIFGYVNDNKWGHPQSPNKVDADNIGDLLAQYFKQCETAFEAGYFQYLLNKEILKNLNNLSLLNHLLKIVDDIKKDENILLISDFYKKISAIIIKEPVPFIYERIGTRYSHYLLDEFQDTSQLQWINMIPLVHDSLSSENMNLIVGDGKQAIYRWRNGEVEQFTKLPKEVHNPDKIENLYEAERLFSIMGEKKPLNHNFRSSETIINFNNALFKDLVNYLSPELKYIYDDVKQIPVKKHIGYVNGYFDKSLEKEDQLEYVLKTIREAEALNYNLRDICIIVRNNKSGSLVANYLTKEGIDIISPDSLLIGKDVYVKFLYFLMNTFIHPKDKNYKIKAIEHYATIKDLSASELLEKHEGFIANHTLAEFFENLNIKILKLDYFHNLYELVESLLESFSFDPSSNPFLQFFLELIHQFEIKNNSNLRDFLEWYSDKGYKKSIISPEGANAVQIMTIHKSKGLQFPVVICPFFDWSFKLDRQISWVESSNDKLPAFFINMKQLLKETELASLYNSEEGKFYLDQLNLIYVAFTRPETALFISGKLTANSPASKWLEPFFSKSDLFTHKGQTFEYGTFNYYPDLIEDNLTDNYELSYLAQKMNKPQLSYKSGNEWSVDDIDTKRNFGTLVHLMLSKITHSNTIKVICDENLIKGIITKDEHTALLNYITLLFKNTHFANYFNESDKILNEKGIINEKGQKLIPDKIIINKQGTLIVDFKTGHPSESHVKQLQTYIAILKQLNYKNVSGELFYTESKEVIVVN